MSDAGREQLLEAENEGLRAENAALASEVEVVRAENAALTRRVDALTRRIDQGSKNSSSPPSSDSPKNRAEATKTRADRRAEAKAKRKDDVDRRRGKQPGAAGSNLAMRSDPDEIVDHEPSVCESCGDDLSDAPVEGMECRQVFDTPEPVRPHCTEHRAVTKRCICGAKTKGTFPTEARGPASYGPNIRASVLYLLMGQHLPVERTAQAMAYLLGCPVSTGFVASLATEAADGLEAFLSEIKARLISSALIHVDETFDQVGTEKAWFHVATNELYTYLVASMTRGRAAPDDAGVLPEFKGVMVHDRLAMYFNYDKATHVICLAHIGRELRSVGIGWDQGWANDMADLLIEMNNAAHAARDAKKVRIPRKVLTSFLGRYDTLAAAGLAANPQPIGRKRDTIEAAGYNLAAALVKLKPEATRFAVDLDVPFTNNAAESAIRMTKIHAKVSNCFQSFEGAKAFAAVRSYLATAAKHDVGPLDVLVQLFRGEAWMPPLTT